MNSMQVCVISAQLLVVAGRKKSKMTYYASRLRKQTRNHIEPLISPVC